MCFSSRTEDGEVVTDDLGQVNKLRASVKGTVYEFFTPGMHEAPKKIIFVQISIEIFATICGGVGKSCNYGAIIEIATLYVQG